MILRIPGNPAACSTLSDTLQTRLVSFQCALIPNAGTPREITQGASFLASRSVKLWVQPGTDPSSQRTYPISSVGFLCTTEFSLSFGLQDDCTFLHHVLRYLQQGCFGLSHCVGGQDRTSDSSAGSQVGGREMGWPGSPCPGRESK